jgi:GH18 family chitinase
MSATPEGRDRFAANASAFCDRLGLDGIDIDWEFPLPSNADAYEALMKSLGTALHAKGRYLSVAVKSHDVYVKDPDVGKNFKSGIFGSVDFLNVMAYDGGGQNHAPFEMAQTEMQYWTATRGCPRAKVILGVPFYGKELKSDGKEVATAYRDLPYADRQVATRDNSGAIWYNGAATIEKKARLAASVGGGIMIWEVAQDAHDETSLLGTIAKLAATFPDIPLALAPIPDRARQAAVFPWIPVRAGRGFSMTGRVVSLLPSQKRF